ncbi:MAG TPA: hypothetical protein VH062_00295 [Polyangiaceae bacterium]|nr:hypothetical protein [Polyangiaceae bacterium]
MNAIVLSSDRASVEKNSRQRVEDCVADYDVGVSKIGFLIQTSREIQRDVPNLGETGASGLNPVQPPQKVENVTMRAAGVTTPPDGAVSTAEEYTARAVLRVGHAQHRDGPRADALDAQTEGDRDRQWIRKQATDSGRRARERADAGTFLRARNGLSIARARGMIGHVGTRAAPFGRAGAALAFLSHSLARF